LKGYRNLEKFKKKNNNFKVEIIVKLEKNVKIIGEGEKSLLEGM